MQYHIKPCLQRKPDEIILHVGTNDLKEINPTEVAKGVLKVCNIIKESPKTKVVISELIIRTDSPNLKDRVDEVNKQLFTYCNQNNWNYIGHKNIGVNHLNTYGLHLNRLGTATLARNILLYLNSDRKHN
jgi:lysophospholipase L1-like esterase